MAFVKRPFEFVAWVLASHRGILHTNWLQGVGVAAFAGQSEFALFRTRKDARAAQQKLYVDSNYWTKGTLAIAQIQLTANRTKYVWVSKRKKN